MTEDISKEKLDRLLKKMSWSLKSLGRGHYDIINHLGKETGFSFYKNVLEFTGDLLKGWASYWYLSQS